jgi:hypothetical protein
VNILRVLWTVFSSGPGATQGSPPPASPPATGADDLKRAAHDDRDAPDGREAALDGASEFDLGEGFISEEDEAERFRAKPAGASGSAAPASDDVDASQVLEPTVPSGAETGAGDESSGEEPGDEEPELQIGERPAEPVEPEGSGGEDEVAALQRLGALYPNTPEGTLRALRQREVDLEQEKAKSSQNATASDLLRRITATPSGRAAAAELMGLHSPAGGAATPAPSVNAPAGAPAPEGQPSAALAGLPSLMDIAQRVSSTDPDVVAAAMADLEKRQAAMLSQTLTGLQARAVAESKRTMAIAQQQEHAAGEMAVLDRILGGEWRTKYGDRALATLSKRGKGLSLAECVLLNAVGDGDVATVAKLSPRERQEAKEREQFHEGGGGGRPSSGGSISPGERRFLKELGVLDQYEKRTPKEGRERSDASDVFDLD